MAMAARYERGLFDPDAPAGESPLVVSLEHFGASGDAQVLFREFGLTADAVVAAARESLLAETTGDTP
jgi:transketolase